MAQYLCDQAVTDIARAAGVVAEPDNLYKRVQDS